MLDFIERLADATGLPVGIKSAVGDIDFWRELAAQMRHDRARARLHHHRRRRGRHRRRAARVHRPRRAAVQARLRAGLPRASPRRASTQDVVFIGSGKLGFPETGAARARARLRHDQRRARGDAGDRLHPGAALPHRPLPDRRRDPEPLADARPRSDAQVGAPRELPRRPAQGSAPPRARLRPAAPGAGAARRDRDRRRQHARALGARGLRLPARLGPAARRRSHRDRDADGAARHRPRPAVREPLA